MPDNRKYKQIPKIITLHTIALFCCISMMGFSQSNEFLMKAVAMEQLSRFIEWPSGVLHDDLSKPFIITVLGKNPFGTFLEEAYEYHKIKDREVEIQYIRTIDDLKDCHILFVSSSEKGHVDSIVSAIKGKPVLMVGDTRGYAEAGILVNFSIQSNKIRFEINEKGLDNAGFKVSFLLIKVAKIINPKNE